VTPEETEMSSEPDISRAPFVSCEGWWEQGWCGRQPMLDLRLQFAQGEIRGSGVDIIGPFEFSGIISATVELRWSSSTSDATAWTTLVCTTERG